MGNIVHVQFWGDSSSSEARGWVHSRRIFVEWRWLGYWEVEGKGLRGSLLETVVAVGAVKDGHGFFPSLDATL